MCYYISHIVYAPPKNNQNDILIFKNDSQCLSVNQKYNQLCQNMPSNTGKHIHFCFARVGLCKVFTAFLMDRIKMYFFLSEKNSKRTVKQLSDPDQIRGIKGSVVLLVFLQVLGCSRELHWCLDVPRRWWSQICSFLLVVGPKRILLLSKGKQLKQCARGSLSLCTVVGRAGVQGCLWTNTLIDHLCRLTEQQHQKRGNLRKRKLFWD